MPASPEPPPASGSARGSIAIVGGCGHVGLPLGLLLADRGHPVTLVDTSPERVEQVRAGRMPFLERGAEPLLRRVLDAGRLRATGEAGPLRDHDTVIVTIGTPVDEFLDPDSRGFLRGMHGILDRMRDGQLLVLRSTVFPGVTDLLAGVIARRGPAVDLAYCPERIAQGYAVEELATLPQIVAGTTPAASERAAALFGSLGVRIVPLTAVEAELAKLFANSYRYIHFAISNQFLMISERFGADFDRIRAAVTADYPRLAGFAGPGFTGGPCLLKDTMQLGAFNHNTFLLGQAAMMVNEGLPAFLIERLEARMPLAGRTVGILGMAFKGDSDDARSSLAYKVRKILSLRAGRVLCTDPFIADPDFVPLERVLAESDALVVGAPHSAYKGIRTDLPLVDPFGFLRRPGA